LLDVPPGQFLPELRKSSSRRTTKLWPSVALVDCRSAGKSLDQGKLRDRDFGETNSQLSALDAFLQLRLIGGRQGQHYRFFSYYHLTRLLRVSHFSIPFRLEFAKNNDWLSVSAHLESIIKEKVVLWGRKAFERPLSPWYLPGRSFEA
jgi:hypothetical protein